MDLGLKPGPRSLTSTRTASSEMTSSRRTGSSGPAPPCLTLLLTSSVTSNSISGISSAPIGRRSRPTALRASTAASSPPGSTRASAVGGQAAAPLGGVSRQPLQLQLADGDDAATARLCGEKGAVGGSRRSPPRTSPGAHPAIPTDASSGLSPLGCSGGPDLRAHTLGQHARLRLPGLGEDRYELVASVATSRTSPARMHVRSAVATSTSTRLPWR